MYITRIYIRQPSHKSIRKERKRLSRITETTVSWLRKGCSTTRKRLFGTSKQPFPRLRIRLLSTRKNVYACMTASYLTSPKTAYLPQHIIPPPTDEYLGVDATPVTHNYSPFRIIMQE